nr:MAG: hypothetical protein [Bacteriophage sp.]
MVAVVHRYTQKTWAFLVGQKIAKRPKSHKEMPTYMTWASTIAFEISEYWRFSDLNGNSKRYLSFSNVGSKIIIIAKIPI